MRHKLIRLNSCIAMSREIGRSYFNIETYAIVYILPFLPQRHSGCLPIGQVSWLIFKLKFHPGKAFHVYLYHLLLSFGLFNDLLNALSTA